jgi:hypothetical protein
MEEGKPIMRDGTVIEEGKEYHVDEAVLCRTGYHGSERILDALKYAPGPWISKRIITGKIDRKEDKICGTKCVHTIGFNATDVLRKVARLCALDVIHLWDAPDVVVKYLKTGDENIRAAAWAAALDTAWDAVWDATRAAALASARDAAWAAAQTVAWNAARDAAWNATLATARNATLAAGWKATLAATLNAIRNAALDTAWDTARDTTEVKQNRRLTRMVKRQLKSLQGEEE